MSEDLNNVILQSNAVDDLVFKYNDTLRNILDNHAPITEKNIIIWPNTSWYNSQIRQLKVQSRRLERKWKKCETDENWKNYRKHCELISNTIKDCITGFYSNKIIESENNKNKRFFVAKTLLGNVKNCVLPDLESNSTIANKFNHYFINKIIKIR